MLATLAAIAFCFYRRLFFRIGDRADRGLAAVDANWSTTETARRPWSTAATIRKA